VAATVARSAWTRLPLPGPVTRVRALTLITAALLWEGLARSGWLYEGVVPPLTAVARAFVLLLMTGETYHHLAVTAWEVAAGFGIGLVSGVAFGIWMGARPFFGRAIAPYVDGLATAPKIIFLPIVMLLFGVGITSKIALGALSAFFPVTLNTAAGMRAINPVLIRVGHSFRLTRAQMVRKVYLPALLGSTIVSMRLGLGVAIIGVLLAEIKLADRGLGFVAIDHYNQFRIPEMYALLLFIFILAIAANVLIGRLSPRRSNPTSNPV
jgi:ABC-type nitrate/sulfonate/bicarbonate transport system permease component